MGSLLELYNKKQDGKPTTTKTGGLIKLYRERQAVASMEEERRRTTPDPFTGRLPDQPQVLPDLTKGRPVGPMTRVPTEPIVQERPLAPTEPTLARRPVVESEEELRAAPKPTFWDKVKELTTKPFRETDEDKKAKDWASYAISKQYGLDQVRVRENLSDITKEIGLRGVPTVMEIGEAAIIAPVVAGLMTNPIVTALGIAGFEALSEVESFIVNKIKGEKYQAFQAKGLENLLPDEANDFTREVVDIFDFIAKGKVLHSIYKKAPALKEQFTKDLITEYKLPEKIYIEPAKVKSIFQTGEKISKAETQMISELGLSGTEYRRAIRDGVQIEVPAEVILKIVDKPYWAKLKQTLGVKQTGPVIKSTRIIGKPVKQPTALLEEPKRAFVIPEGKPTEVVSSLTAKLKTKLVQKQRLLTERATPEIKASVERLQRVVEKLEKAPVVKEKAPVVKPEVIEKPKPIVKVKVVEKPTKLFHGSADGKLKIDRAGNINLGVSKSDVGRFGDVVEIDTAGLKIKEFKTKEELFNAAIKKLSWQRKGFDILKSGNHAIAINPKRFAKEFGRRTKDIRLEKIGTLQKRFEKAKLPKREVGRPKVPGTITQEEAFVKRALVRAKEREAAKKIKSVLEKGKPKEKETPQQIRERLTIEKAEVAARRKLGEFTDKEIDLGINKKLVSDKSPEYARLLKLKEDGKDQAYFSQLALDKSLDYMSGKSKIDESAIIEKFIDDHFLQGSETAYYARESKALGFFEKRGTAPQGEFKLYEEGFRLIKKYAKKVSEKYIPRGNAGVMYKDTLNIAVKSLNNISTVIHEIAHVLDKGNLITKKVMTDRSGNKKVIKDLKDVYMKHYSRPSKSAKLETKIIEGFATLVELQVSQPSVVKANYNYTANAFLREGGEFYNPLFKEFLKDSNLIVEKYQGLSSLDKIKSRVVHKTRKGREEQGYFKLFDTIRTQAFDNVWGIEKIAMEAGVHYTMDDPSLWMRHYNRASNIYGNNISSKNGGYWTLGKDGEFHQKYDYNWNTLAASLEQHKLSEDYGAYLVSRDAYYNHLRVAEEILKGDKGDKEMIAHVTKVLKKTGITREEAIESYNENKSRFKEYDKVYDELVQADLDMLHHPLVRIIDDATYKELSARKGYSPSKKVLMDEFGDPEGTSAFYNKGTAINTLAARTGSEKPILSPVLGSIQNHAEVLRKSIKQIVFNKLLELSTDFPTVFQAVPLEAVPSGKRMVLPQSKDPNIIFARDKDFKTKALIVDKEIRKVFEVAFDSTSIGVFEKIAKTSARWFVKGTTGMYIPFALTNIALDSISVTAQSRNKLVPILSSLNQMRQLFTKKAPQIRGYVDEFFLLGGHMQTFIKMTDKSPEQIFQELNRDKKILDKVLDTVDYGMDFVSKPSQYSELINRMGEYIKARKNGKSQLVAIEESGRVTASFHHKGRLGNRAGRIAVSSYPFANAQLQVLHTAMRASVDPVTRAKAAVLFTMMTALQVASFMSLIYALKKAKEKGGEAYETMKKFADQRTSFTTYEASNYLWYINNDKYKKLRVPNTYNAAGSIANLLLANHYLDAGYSGKDFLDVATDTVIPRQLNLTRPKEMAASIIPHIVKPEMLTAFGLKDFPEVEPIVSFGMKFKPAKEQYYDDTNDLAKLIGKSLNVSPLKVEYYMKTRFGRTLDELTKKMFTPEDYASSIVKSFTRTWEKGDYLFSGRIFDKFYEEKTDTEQKYKVNEESKEAWGPQKRFNTEVANIISALKKIDRANIDIPQNYKNMVFEMVNKINTGDRGEALLIYNELLLKDLDVFVSKNKQK